MPRIGELLVAEGVLSELAVQNALGFQRHTGEPFRLGTILIDRDLLSEEALLQALARIHRCDYVTWQAILRAPREVVRQLPEKAAIRLAAFPYAWEGRGLRVAFKNPSNLAAVDEVSAVTGRPVVAAVITEVRLFQAHNLFYGRPIPIEFRGIVHKLERAEERKVAHQRATRREPWAEQISETRRIPVGTPLPREIPIARPAPSPEPPRPRVFAAPFSVADGATPTAEMIDFLPDFQPILPLTPEEFVARMWQAEAGIDERDDIDVSSMWETVPEEVAAPPDQAEIRDRIAESALEALLEQFPRALLMICGQNGVLGWLGRGAGLTRERVSRLIIPWGAPSIFAFVKLSGSPHRGPLSRVLVPGALVELVGPKAAASVGVYPVRIKDRLVAFLWVDRMGAPLAEQDFRALEAAASSLGSSLARFLADRRKAVPAD